MSTLPRSRKTDTGRLERRCEAAWRKAVLTRDGHKCRFCGDHKNLEAAHIVARTQSLNTKFDLENGLTLCSWCHRYWTGEPVEFAKRVALELGERFQALLARSGIKVYSPGPAWFQMRLDELKGMR